MAGGLKLSNSTTAHSLTIAGSGTTYVSGPIADGNGSSGGGLTYSGNGLLVFAGSNTYTGATTLASGTLQVASGGAIGSGGGSAVAVNGGLLNVVGANGLTGSSALTVATGATAVLAPPTTSPARPASPECCN